MTCKPYYLMAMIALFASPAQAVDGRDVGAALEAWVAAVESGSAENIVALYGKEAVMISTFVQAPITSHAALLGYYKKVVANPDIEVTVEETHPRRFGDMAVSSGRYTLSYTQEGEPVTIPARFSFTYQWRGGKWIIVDHHSSRVPLADEPGAGSDEFDE